MWIGSGKMLIGDFTKSVILSNFEKIEMPKGHNFLTIDSSHHFCCYRDMERRFVSESIAARTTVFQGKTDDSPTPLPGQRKRSQTTIASRAAMFAAIGPMGGLMGAPRPRAVVRPVEFEEDEVLRDDDDLCEVVEEEPVVVRRSRRANTVRNPSIIVDYGLDD
jgi:hypothetical protein